MNSVSFVGVLVLVMVIRHGSEGIQGGAWVEKDKHIPFLGSLVLPALGGDKIYRCAVIMVNLDIGITAGHCLLYDSRHSILMLNFTKLIVYVSLGTKRVGMADDVKPRDDEDEYYYEDIDVPVFTRFQEIRVVAGYLHDNYAPIGGFEGISASNDIGAVMLERSYLPYYRTYVDHIREHRWPNTEIKRVIRAHARDSSKICRIYSWGSSMVRPPVAESHMICSSPRCDREREARCLLPKNPSLKELEIKLIDHKRCSEQWGLRGVTDDDEYYYFPRIRKIMDSFNYDCFETKNLPVKGGKNDSTTIGDEGAPVVCNASASSQIVIGMFVGSAYKSLSGNVHFDYRAPNFWISFTEVKSFNHSLHVRLGRLSSTRKFVSNGVPRLAVPLVSIILMFIVCLQVYTCPTNLD